MDNGFDWVCPTHNTFGDNGWSCSICGYPMGAKIFEFDKKTMTIKRLKGYINLFFFKLLFFETESI